jgi:hypothetical protein
MGASWAVVGFFVFVLYLRRFWKCLPSLSRSPSSSSFTSPQKSPLSCLVIFGSGGHTTEMLRIIQRLKIEKFSPMYFVLAQVLYLTHETLLMLSSFQSDRTSIGKIQSSQVRFNDSRHSDYLSLSCWCWYVASLSRESPVENNLQKP